MKINLIPPGLFVYAWGLVAASRWFLGETSLYGYHPGLWYGASLLLSLVACQAGRQSVQARGLLASAGASAAAGGAGLLALRQLTRWLLEQSLILWIVVMMFLWVPTVVAVVAAPVLLFGYHVVLAGGRKSFPALALLGLSGLALCGLRIYAAYRPELQVMTNQAQAAWLIAYASSLLFLGLEYWTGPVSPSA